MGTDEIPTTSDDVTGFSEGTLPAPKAHLVRNVSSQVALFVTYVVVGIWFTRYQIQYLGIENYGMVVLAFSFTAYVNVATIAISGALGRYVTLHLARGQNKEANSCFNTQFLAIAGMAVGLLPAFGLFSFYSPGIVTTPIGQEQPTRLLFFGILLSFSISMISAAFAISTFAKQRFDLKNLADILMLLVRVLVIVALFNLLTPSLWQIGIGAIAGAIVNTLLSFAIFRRLTPELVIRLRGGFDSLKFKEMLGTGVWMSVGSLGLILYLKIDLLVINKILGPSDVGRYAVVLQQSTMIRSLASAIAGILTPVLVALFARKDFEGLMRVSARAVKFMGLALAMPLGLLCGLSRPFLTWWLGPDYAALSPLMWIMMAHLVISLSGMPLSGINLATNRLGLPGAVTLATGVFNLALAITLAKTSLGIFGVALAGAISLTLKNAIFTPWYAARVVNASAGRFVPAIAIGVVAFATAAAMSYGSSLVLDLASLWRLAATGVATCIVCMPLSYFLLLNSGDRRFLVTLLPFKTAK